MGERDKTCAERIGEHRDSRIGDFKHWAEVMDASDLDDISDEALSTVTNEAEPDRDEHDDMNALNERAYEWANEYPLAVTKLTVVRIDLSTGGPGDWLEAHVDDDKDIRRIEYHFNDWFDHASVVLEGLDYDAAERFVEFFLEGLMLDA